VYASYTKKGFAGALDGMFGGVRFAYIDTRQAIGCMVELIEENSVPTDFFQRIAVAAEGWDGISDPLRPAFPE
jgi:hypothetical protein